MIETDAVVHADARVRRGWRPTADQRAIGLLVAMAYVPILLTRPGMISADTKVYLTLDPVRLMTRAWSMWDPWVGAGTVTHQTIGYLFPLGPVYTLSQTIGIPDWLVQRLIWGSIVLAAGVGAFRLARSLHHGIAAALVMGIAYGWSPYLLAYLARLSVILLPWAALPWLIMLASAAVRTRRWAAPARFALIVAVIGSVNASSLLLVGLGPAIWVLAELLGGRYHLRAVLAGAARTLVLTIGVSLWWIIALRIQGNFGLPILRFTETYQTIASASTPPEIMRGIGYWFSYGGDRLSPWVEATQIYAEPWMIGLGSVLVAASLIGLNLHVPGRRRALLLLVTGLTVAVGAAPLGSATPYGRVFEEFATHTTAGLALRSTPRAAPLVILALAFGLAAFTTRAQSLSGLARHRARTTAVPIIVIAALIVQLIPWFSGRAVTTSILRATTLPSDQIDLAQWLERPDAPSGRVWELPGADFAAHRWGGTIDTILPGLIDRPTLQRALVPQGAEITDDLLAAFDRRLHEGVVEPDALVPLTGLLGIETVVVRNDLEHERFRLVRPNHLWPYLSEALGSAGHSGPIVSDTPQIPMVDEIALATERRSESFPSVAAWDLQDPRPLIEVSDLAPMIVAGNGEGLVDLAEAGLLETHRPIVYAGTVSRQQAIAESGIGPPSLVVTDTNRRQGRRWSTLSVSHGALETAGEVAIASDPTDQRLGLHPNETDLERTVLRFERPVRQIRATSYGNRIAYTPEDAARFAMDDDPRTAWRTGVFDDIRGEYLEIDLVDRITANNLTILQPTTLITSRYLTEIRLVFDDAGSLDVPLDDRSRALPGQTIEFEPRSFSRLRIELLADNLGPLSSYRGQPGVGIAEVRIPGVEPSSTTVMPTAWLTAIDEFTSAPLSVVMTRLRLDPATLNRADPEPIIDRMLDLPEERTFTLSGIARLEPTATDQTLAGALGVAGGAHSDTRLLGSPSSWAVSAFDGSETSAWTTGFDEAHRARLRIDLGTPRALDQLIITAADLETRSLPLTYEVILDADRAGSRSAEVRADHDRAELTFDGAEATTVDVVITSIDERTTAEYFSGAARTLPTSITEIAITDTEGQRLGVNDLSGRFPNICRDDLVFIDDRPIPVKITASIPDALGRAPLSLELCGPDLVVDAGPRRITTTPGHRSGLSVDRLVLTSSDATSGTTSGATPIGSGPDADFERRSPTSFVARVPSSDTPLWLTLRESWSAGWRLTIENGPNSGFTSEPFLIDGFANGWMIPAADVEQSVRIDWIPQRQIGLGLTVSALSIVAAVTLALRRRREPHHGAAPVGPSPVRVRLETPLWTAGLFVVGGWPGAVAYLCIRVLAPHLRGRWRHWLPGVVAVGAWSASALFIAALQFGYRYPVDPQWPARFSAVSPLTWVAVAALIAGTTWGARRASPNAEPSGPRE